MLLRQITLAAVLAVASLSAQVPDFTPPTPLFGAVLRNDIADAKKLLASGANPNEGRFLGAPAIFIALMQHNDALTQALIDGGADVKLTDGAGSSTLMWAAMSETGDATITRELLRRGVDPNVVNKMGESALTWALRRGHTPIVAALKAAGASDGPMIRQSVEKAVALLAKSGPQFAKVSSCSSCHNQSLPQMAFKVAKDHGFTVDPQVSEAQTKAVIALFRPVRDIMLAGKENIPDPAISVSYSLVGLAAEGYQADDTTAAMAHLVSLQQNPDGSFRCFVARPPMESSPITAAALSLRALQVYGKDSERQIDKARGWLLTTKPETNEEHVMKVLGLVWSKAKASDIKAAAAELAKLQHVDGGWSQLPLIESDAYATGAALVALHMAGFVATKDEAYERGAGFLLRTQNPDGSWLVRSRAFPFQPYKESGFPHGKHQWISAAGTSWAVMALSLSTPATTQISQLF